jgi:hypothetical protein
MTPETKVPPVTNAADVTDQPQPEPPPTTRTKGQKDTSDARLSEIIARAVEKVKRPLTVSEQTNTYLPKVAPFVKKTRPKGREGSR